MASTTQTLTTYARPGVQAYRVSMDLAVSGVTVAGSAATFTQSNGVVTISSPTLAGGEKLVFTGTETPLAITGVTSSGGSTSSAIKDNLAATAAPTVANDSSQGYAVGSTWFRSDTGAIWRCRDASVGAAKWDKLGASDFPGYVAGNSYFPSGPTVSGVITLAAGSIRFVPFIIKERVTLSAIGVRITTLSASGNVQAAIYASSPTTKKPTGTPLVSTASMSTGAVAVVSTAVSLQLEPGLYWSAINCDNSTAAATNAGNAGLSLAQNIGSATLGGALTNTPTAGLTLAQTFGTWPDVTSSSFVESAISQPIIGYTVGSSP